MTELAEKRHPDERTNERAIEDEEKRTGSRRRCGLRGSDDRARLVQDHRLIHIAVYKIRLSLDLVGQV